MKAIMVMYDSLRRDLLSANGGPIPTPNFERLAEHSVQFDRCYAGSLPCMPARRELQTGRYNFLHRSWGPMEPFDDSLPQILSERGIYTHIATDHYHYVQDGGATYMGRFDSWECYRGQESDQYVADLSLPFGSDAPNQLSPESANARMRAVRQRVGWNNMANRELLKSEADYPMSMTFANGLDFLRRNGERDNWYLQIETFDPHEPFTAPEEFQLRFLDPDSLSFPDWPQYARCSESAEEIEKLRKKYYALTAFCDYQLGKVLDLMDEMDLWKDTMLIVNTDHGFLLSEHQRWGKGTSPNYEELVHNPLFVYDPRFKRMGDRCPVLCQTIDIVPTILEFFRIDRTADMTGVPLRAAIERNECVRKVGIFGYLGGHLGITDGRYVLLHEPVNKDVPVNEYTLMPTHMKSFFTSEELSTAELVGPFDFSKGLKVIRTKARINPRFTDALGGEDLLFDLERDPEQERPFRDVEIEERLKKGAHELFVLHDAPSELYRYFDI